MPAETKNLTLCQRNKPGLPVLTRVATRTVRFPALLVSAVACVVGTSLPAAAHWCNSGARLNTIERAICSDPALVGKDIELNRLYAALGGSRNPGLKAGQRNWLNGRNRCTSMDCLYSYYDSRLGVLRSMAGVATTPAPPQPTYTPPPPPPAAPSAPGSGSIGTLPDIKPF